MSQKLGHGWSPSARKSVRKWSSLQRRRSDAVRTESRWVADHIVRDRFRAPSSPPYLSKTYGQFPSMCSVFASAMNSPHSLVQNAINALRNYRKLFALVIPGLTDTVPIYAAYEQIRHNVTKHTILLLVESQTMREFRETLARLTIRKSSEWRSFSTTGSSSPD